MADPIATAEIRWLTEAENGRNSGPPTGSEYAATAAFDSAEGQVLPDVSIVIWCNEGTASTTEGKPAVIGFLAPQLLGDALVPGRRFVVKEGSRAVAEGVVTGLIKQWDRISFSLPEGSYVVAAEVDQIATALWEYGEEGLHERVTGGLTDEQLLAIGRRIGEIWGSGPMLVTCVALAAVEVLEGRPRPLARKRRRIRKGYWADS